MLFQDKMYTRNLFFLLLIIAVSSCNHKTVFKEVTINNRYTIAIPDYLQPCTDLHKDASLQYQNIEKDIYTLVIDEKKSTMADYNLAYDIDLYFKNIASQPFLDNIKNGKISPPGRQQINGNKALIADITGEIAQTNVYYKICIIETPFTFYQILIWTRLDTKEKFDADMTTMVESFKEFPLPKEELPQPKLSDSVTIVPAW